MTDVNIEAPQLTNGIMLADTDSSTRTQQLQQLFMACYGTLQATAYETYPQLLAWDCEHLLTTVNQRFTKYKGTAERDAFERWAVRLVRKEALRYKIHARILSDYDRVIHAAIHESIWTSALDRSTTHEDVYSEISWLIFKKAHALNRSGEAKLSTRLYALTKKHVWFYHNTRNSRRRALVEKRVNDGQSICREQLSDAELASMKAESPIYDPGYSEVGLSLL